MLSIRFLYLFPLTHFLALFLFFQFLASLLTLALTLELAFFEFFDKQGKPKEWNDKRQAKSDGRGDELDVIRKKENKGKGERETHKIHQLLQTVNGRVVDGGGVHLKV